MDKVQKHNSFNTVEVKLYAFLTLALDVDEWSASRPERFATGENAPGTHLIGGWVNPRDSLKAVAERKSPIIAPAGN
jgi:hypothetical protein